MRILITGATGLIGTHLMQRLQDVAVLSRSPGRVTSRLPWVRAFKWDPLGGPPPAAAFDGVDVIVNLAGEPIADGQWTAKKKRSIKDSRVIGTRNLVAGIRNLNTKPPVIISGSAVGIYGDRGQERLDETSNPGTGFLAEVCQEWENAAAEASTMGIRVVRIRTGLVLADNGGALERIMKPFRFGLGGHFGSGKQWMPWIHVKDVVGLLIHAATTPAVEGPMNAVSPYPATNIEFTRQLGLVLGRPALFAVPSPILRLALGEMSTILIASQRVSPTVAQRTGYRWEYPYLDQALRESTRLAANN